MLMKKIKEIKFGILSPEQIRKMSAIEIKSPETYDKDGFPMEGGLMDNHLGVINPGLRCKTCGNTMKKCPGHFGTIELIRPVVHSEFGKKLEQLMHATCKSCGRIVIAEEKLEQLKAFIGDTQTDIAKKIVTRTKKVEKCPHCQAERVPISLDKPTNFYISKDRIYPTEIREWVEKIPDADLEFFGYEKEKLRPEWFIMTALQVPPINLRPSITLESGIKSEDDLTHKLVDIIRINLRLRDNIDAGAPQLIIEDLWDLLQYHVTTYINNNTAGVPPAKHRSGRALRTLVQRLQGKKGRFRYNLTGKRVNYAARSVITPDPTLSINELGIPREIAESMTIPEALTKDTIPEAKKAIKELMKRWRGNGLDSANLIFYNAVKTYTLGGDFFAEIVRNRRNKITNLKPLNPSTVKVKANTKGIITSYEVFPVLKQQDSSNATTKVDVKDMFHLAYNRIADQIHGQSVIKKLMPIIEMRRESMQDIRVVFHRYVKPLLISSVDTDDATEIAKYKAKLDKAMAKGENLVVPKGTVDNIERISIPQFSTLDPLPWLQLLQNEFIKAEGVPAIVMAVGAESTEAESKILYLAWQQLVEFNQMFLEEQIYNQLGLEVEFEFPASIAPELIKDEKKDPPLTSNKVDPRKDQK